MIRRGEIWWAALPAARGSDPGFRRPVLVVQSDDFNRSEISTAIVVALTSNAALASAPGNILLSRRASGLPRPSVANVSQVLTIDESFLTKRVRKLNDRDLARVEAGLRLVLGL